MATKAIFLDRDGVLNRLITERGPRETPTKPEELELLPNVTEALALLKSGGFTLIVVTNQPNVAKGKSTWEEQVGIEQKLVQLLGENAKVDAVYSCYHHPDPKQVVVPSMLNDCECRKPKPGLLHQAAKHFDIDFDTAWLIGDNSSDIEAGLAAGIKQERLISIGGTATIPVRVANNLFEAAQHILRMEETP